MQHAITDQTPSLETSSPDDALTTRQAARLLGMAEITLHQARLRGDGPPFFRIGRAVRYVRRDVLAYRDARMVGGAQ
jgi:predicted DNA-binding transcriptional regulator AlpA